MMTLMTNLSLSDWESFLEDIPNAHLLQTGLWGEFKSGFGWEPYRLVLKDRYAKSVGAQILFRRFPMGFRMAYIPKGPVTLNVNAIHQDDWNNFWPLIDEVCREKNAFLLKVEPDLLELQTHSKREETITKPIANYLLPTNNLEGEQKQNIPEGFRPGLQNIQPHQTIIVSLNGDDDRILGRMKQKTRYNIRLALKKGVIVRSCTNIDQFYTLLKNTGSRDSFDVHSLEYYRRVYDIFYPRGMCELFIAEYQNEPLAMLMVFAHGKRAWYFYGASGEIHRERMPTYLLQWEAMRWARSVGCTEYDLWGIPDEDEETLEANFTQRNDGLWGVYRFKRGFGGRIFRTVNSWDRVFNSTLYSLYCLWMSK
jgi:lipid II:glycine glycyltransferase (peptidoglycan interpeptide bridge formation enzyme)